MNEQYRLHFLMIISLIFAIPMKPSSSSPLFFSLFISFAATFTISSGEVALIDGLKNYHEIKLPKVTGPESIAFDCNGEGPYVGVSDGRILKWKGSHKGWDEFAITSPHRDRKLCDGSTDPNKEPTCGRPLGLKFNKKTCHLYIADAYFGLLMVGPSGGVAKLLAISTDENAAPFKFLNGLDVDDKSGVVYFSDSSTVFQRKEYQLVVLTGDKTGRLLKYDPNSKKVQVLVQGLAFPNAVALSKDGSFLLLAESSFNIIHKVWLKGSKACTAELFAALERAPDNIKTHDNGDFWVAMNSYRAVLGNNTNVVQKESIPMPWWNKKDPVAVKFDENGEALEVLDGGGGQELNSVSEVEEHDGRLWIGSVGKDYVAIVNNV